jgi:hypothetical protein
MELCCRCAVGLYLNVVKINSNISQFVSKSREWCAVTEFEVEYEDGVHWLKLYQGKEMTTRMSNLLPDQEYQIRVRAVGRDKAFPFSDIVSVVTKVGGKCNKYIVPVN